MKGMQLKCVCGKLFFEFPSRIKLGRGKFCSKECSYKNRIRPTGLHYSYKKPHPVWEKLREKVGVKNPMWMGDDVGYRALHKWVEAHLGNPKKCEDCGDVSSNRFHWANVSHYYRRDLSDWKRLCPKCHGKFDSGYRRGISVC